MIELLGKMPKDLALSGKHYKVWINKKLQKFFTRKGCLRRIQGFHFWSLNQLLIEKYRIKENEAKLLADFLLPMLDWYPSRRATAEEMLNHPWLSAENNYDYKISEEEYKRRILMRSVEDVKKSVEKGDLADSEHDLNRADIEDNDRTMLSGAEDFEETLSEEEEDTGNKKYSLHSNLLNVDHGPNPQFN